MTCARRVLSSIAAFAVVAAAAPSSPSVAAPSSSSPVGPSPDGPTSTTTATTARDRFPQTWVSDLFYETLATFTVQSKDVGSPACRRQALMYARHLKNGSIWAVQMSDSWSRYPNGILEGTTHQMGVYEECVGVQQPVQGKFCIPVVKLESATGEDFTVDKPDEPQINDPAWREILGFVDKDIKVERNEVKFGICIPDSCSATDLEISLQEEFDKHFLPHQVKAQVEVESILCSTKKDEFPFDNGFYFTSVLVGLIFFICVSSTVYHLTTMTRISNGKKTSKIPELINVFSLIRNARDLIKYDRNNELNIFNGLKCWTMVLILFGHKFLYLSINPISYGKKIEMVLKIGPDFLLTCMNLVDPFFFISGYLIYVMLVPEFSKPGTNFFRVPMIIIYKYMRILPSYAIVMLLTAFVIPHLGDGPFWASRMWPEAEYCKKYWWTNILAVSNFINAENQCLIASWYISCLFQMLAIGCVVVYAHVKNRRVGTYVIVLLLCSSLVVPSVMTYTYHGWSIIKLSRSFLLNPRRSFEFNHLYRAFYLRSIPFCAGLLAGIVVEDLKKRAIKFSQTVVWAGTLIIIVACVWVQLYGVKFYDVYRPYDVLEQSLYSVLIHCTWTVILFWATVCQFTTGYGPIEKLFDNRIVIPLGRLSFAVYIVNITVMMYIESRQRVTIYPSPEFIVDGWIFGSFRTYFTALTLYLFIEAPFGLLIKKMFFKFDKSAGQVSTNVINKTETEQKDSTNL